MTTIVGISGSLRRGSYNTSLLRAAAQLMPNNAQLRIETIREIPLYDGDLEAAEGIPPAGDGVKGGCGICRWAAPCHSGVQQLDPGRIQERDRLALAATGRHSPRFWREVGRTNWSLARRFRHHSQPECLASRAAHTRCRTVV